MHYLIVNQTAAQKLGKNPGKRGCDGEMIPGGQTEGRIKLKTNRGWLAKRIRGFLSFFILLVFLFCQQGAGIKVAPAVGPKGTENW